MVEQLYTSYPGLYDAIQSDWDYERDVQFVTERHRESERDTKRLLEIGCGTGEHTKRLLSAGFDVTAVDKYEGMLQLAREKCETEFVQSALPDLAVAGEFDIIAAIRGVCNHLPPEDLKPALENIKHQLASDGIFLFDNSPLPPDGTGVGLDVGMAEQGQYARLAQHVPTGDGQLEWRSVMFGPDGEFFVNSRSMTPFADETLETALADAGFDVETHDGYGPDDDRTVFVATG